MNTTANILIVDDDPVMIRLLSLMLDREGYTVHGVTSGADALMLLRNQPIDIMLTDYSMPQMNGVELIRETRKTHPNLIIYIVTAYAADYLGHYGSVDGVQEVLSKPLEIQSFLDKLVKVLNSQEYHKA